MRNEGSKKRENKGRAKRLLDDAKTRFAFLLLLAVSELGPMGFTQLRDIVTKHAA